MKKLISCLLAVLLVCSVMSMNVFAAEHPAQDAVVAGDQYWVVGTQGDNKGTNDSINDGSESPNGSASADINVNFKQPGDDIPDGSEDDPSAPGNGTVIVNRYAVDIVYGELILDLTNLDFTPAVDTNGNGTADEEAADTDYYMVWDVNKYEYVLCTKNGDDYVPVDDATTNEDESAELLKTPFTVTGGLQIINHSDLAVATKVALANTAQINWSVKGANTAGNEVIEEVEKAIAKVGDTDGHATEGTEYSFEATPTTDWADVISQFMNGTSGTQVTVGGTINVTIAKSGAFNNN